MTYFTLRSLCALLSVFSGSAIAQEHVVTNTEQSTHALTGVRIVRGTLQLPRGGWWFMEGAFTDYEGLTEVFLGDNSLKEAKREGVRIAGIKDRQARTNRHREGNRINWACRSFARKGDGLAPKSLVEVENAEDFKKITGFHFIPEMRLVRGKEGGPLSESDGALPFLIDTTPAIDDGKHWVWAANGGWERRAIDQELIAELGLTITPQALPHADREKATTTTVEVPIYARVTGELGMRTLTVQNHPSKETLQIKWDLSQVSEGSQELCAGWAALRVNYFRWAARPGAPLPQHWLARMHAQYGLAGAPGRAGDTPFRGRRANVMSVLGGRAAIEETLQLRQLRGQKPKKEEQLRAVPVGEIEGVKVAAHPFEEMLGGEAGGRIALAEWIPHDHFLAYFPKPDGVFALLEGGTDFVFAAGSTITGNSAAYRLKDRHLERFGLSEALLRAFLKTGAVEEMAATVPDLFLLDGTEMTVVMRLGNPLLAGAALGVIGVPPRDGTTVKTLSGGEKVYWHRRGEILVVSTSVEELDAILSAKDKGGNLGASAELRYMLTQVPVTEATTSYLYFSDPFIRRLVGPEMKIGQLRRLLARSELEEVTAASLLARFEGRGEQAADLSFLHEHGYLANPIPADEVRLDADGKSHSKTYGSVADLKTLAETPVTLVSDEEQEAYKSYRENYDRFWRQFFDPIAIRYEQHPDSGHQLETFILPLVDNSLYNGLRQLVPPEESIVPLRVPIIEPQPIAMLSFNLNEEAWIEMIEDFSQPFEHVLGLDGTILDLLGPDLHLAIQDADPIISIGNGELGALFGQFGGRLDDEMIMIPVLVSALTRPCTLHIGLSDPREMRKKLAEMTWAADMGDSDDFGSGSLTQIAGQQKWIYRYSIEGIITLRFGIEVQDRYLIINNLPFSNKITVTGHKRAQNSVGHLELNPAACDAQLGALFSSAVERSRDNATTGGASLFPLLLDGTMEIAAAGKRHRELFGYEPLHPAGGTWLWDAKEGSLKSSLFGSHWSQMQPDFDPENAAIGIFRQVEEVDLSMQFEHDGLRSTIRWKTR